MECVHSALGIGSQRLLSVAVVQVWAQAGPSAAGCPVGCLPSYKHAVDVRSSRGGEREEWLKTDGDLPQGNIPGQLMIVRCCVCFFNWNISTVTGSVCCFVTRSQPPLVCFSFYCIIIFWFNLMGQRKRKKTQGRLPLLSPALLLLYFHGLIRHTQGAEKCFTAR